MRATLMAELATLATSSTALLNSSRQGGGLPDPPPAAGLGGQISHVASRRVERMDGRG